MRPGLWLQRLTTRTPDLEQLEVAITSLRAVMTADQLADVDSRAGLRVPAVAPAVFSGLRLGLAHSWLYLVAAELIASSMGLGFLLIDSQNTGRTDVMLLAILLLALLGKASDILLSRVERRLIGTRP